jgi:hypothetical protein
MMLSHVLFDFRVPGNSILLPGFGLLINVMTTSMTDKYSAIIHNSFD